MAGLLATLILLYMVAIIGVGVLSWVRPQPGTPVYEVFTVLRRITDPVLEPLRRVIPPVGGVLDISPMIVLVVLSVIRGLL